MNARQARRLKKLVRSLQNPIFVREESFKVIDRTIDRYTTPSCKKCGRQLVDGERRICNDCDIRQGMR